MASKQEIFADYSNKELERLVVRSPWCSVAHLALAQRGEQTNKATRLVGVLHPTALIAPKRVDIEQLTHLTADDVIDRFLHRDSYRITSEDDNEEDMSKVNIEAEEDMVSEDLAEIYEKQGLYCEAIDTYRKLSLLNSEKSVYFARQIADIESKMEKTKQ